MANQVPTVSESGLSTLVQEIVSDIGDLIKHQIQFARTEVKNDLRKSQRAATLLALGVGGVFLGLVIFSLMLVHLLHYLTLPAGTEVPGLPLWACYAIVSVLFLGIGTVLALLGKKEFDSFNPLPDQTVESMKENVEWIANSK